MKLGVVCFVTLLACASAYEVDLLTEDEFNQLADPNRKFN